MTTITIKYDETKAHVQGTAHYWWEFPRDEVTPEDIGHAKRVLAVLAEDFGRERAFPPTQFEFNPPATPGEVSDWNELEKR